MPAASSDCRGTLPAGCAEPKDRDEELGELLLNSKVTTSDPAPPKRRNGDIGSLWFDIRGHLHRFDLKFEMAPAVEEMGTPAKRLQLRVPHVGPPHCSQACEAAPQEQTLEALGHDEGSR